MGRNYIKETKKKAETHSSVFYAHLILFRASHPHSRYRTASKPNMYIFSLWEEAGVHTENPHRHGGSADRPPAKTWTWNFCLNGDRAILCAASKIRNMQMGKSANCLSSASFVFWYPVGEEELSLCSQEVGQVSILAVFHNHHQRTWWHRRFKMLALLSLSFIFF